MDLQSPQKVSAITAIRIAVENTSENDPLVSIFVAPTVATVSANSTLPTPQLVTTATTPAQSMHSFPSFAGAVSRNRKTSMSLSSNPAGNPASHSHHNTSSLPASAVSPKCQSLSNTISTLSKEFQVDDDYEVDMPRPRLLPLPNSMSPNSLNHAKNPLLSSPLHPRQHLLRPTDAVLSSTSGLLSPTSPNPNVPSPMKESTVFVGELVMDLPREACQGNAEEQQHSRTPVRTVMPSDFSASSVSEDIIGALNEERRRHSSVSSNTVTNERRSSGATAAPSSPKLALGSASFGDRKSNMPVYLSSDALASHNNTSGEDKAPVDTAVVSKGAVHSSSSSAIDSPAIPYLGGEISLGGAIHKRLDYGGSDRATIDTNTATNTTTTTTLTDSSRKTLEGSGSRGGPVAAHNRSQTLPGNSATLEDELIRASLSHHPSGLSRHPFTPLARSTVTAAPSATFNKSSSPKSKSSDPDFSSEPPICFAPRPLSVTQSNNNTNGSNTVCDEADDATASLTFGGPMGNIINLHALPTMLSKVSTVSASAMSNMHAVPHLAAPGNYPAPSMESSANQTKNNIAGTGSIVSMQQYNSRTNAFSTATISLNNRPNESDSTTHSNSSDGDHHHNHYRYEGDAVGSDRPLEVPLLMSQGGIGGGLHPFMAHSEQKDRSLSMPTTTTATQGPSCRGFDTATATLTFGTNADDEDDDIYEGIHDATQLHTKGQTTAVITIEGSSSEGSSKQLMMEGVGGTAPRIGINVNTTTRVVRIASHSKSSGEGPPSSSSIGNIVVMKSNNLNPSSWAAPASYSSPSSNVSDNPASTYVMPSSSTPGAVIGWSPSVPKRSLSKGTLPSQHQQSQPPTNYQPDTIDTLKTMSLVEAFDVTFAALVPEKAPASLLCEPYSGNPTRLPDIRLQHPSGTATPPLTKALTLTAPMSSFQLPQRASSLVYPSSTSGSPPSPVRGITRKPNPMALPTPMALSPSAHKPGPSVDCFIPMAKDEKASSVSCLSPLLLGEAQQLRTNVEQHNNGHRNPVFSNTLTAEVFDACKPLELSPEHLGRREGSSGPPPDSPYSVSPSSKAIRRRKDSPQTFCN